LTADRDATVPGPTDADLDRMEGDARRLAGLRQWVDELESGGLDVDITRIFAIKQAIMIFSGAVSALKLEADVLTLVAEVWRLRARLAEMEVPHA
jgi:hypothetical protein